jgi:hypothetical protein
MAPHPIVACFALVAGLPLTGVSSSEPPARTSTQLEPKLIRDTVEALCLLLNQEYFDPAVAARTSEGLRDRLLKGRYLLFTSGESLGKALTADMYEMTRDKHLVLSPIVEPSPSQAMPTAIDSTPREVTARRSNFGVQSIEILPGNVGYFRLTAFYRPAEAREAIASAMTTLRHADALILDLRDNGGGSSGTVALMASYFFEASGLPLFEVAPRPPAKATRFDTESAPLQDRNEQRPVYILISQNTWSGGEGLAFILQERRRAEVVGQATPGAGNQGRTHRLNAWFEVTISNGRVRTAFKGGSWEGTGVMPDVATPPSDALRVAHAWAIRGLVRKFPVGAWHDVLVRELATLEGQHP